MVEKVEYNEYKHGTRDEAIIASLRPFLTKLASALCIVIVTVSYLIFGVTNYTNQISDYEQMASLGEITDEAKLSGIAGIIGNVAHGQTVGLLLSMTVLPCALMLASYFLYKKHYVLDEEEYDRICAELDKRNNRG